MAIETCPQCEGQKEGYFSCCTGEMIDPDIAMCPDCKEHLGEETCDVCGGTGAIMD